MLLTHAAPEMSYYVAFLIKFYPVNMLFRQLKILTRFVPFCCRLRWSKPAQFVDTFQLILNRPMSIWESCITK